VAQDRCLAQYWHVRRTQRSTIALCLGGLATLALLLLLGGSATRGPVAVAEPRVASAIVGSGSYTTYLPLTTRYYDPGYVSPFGIRMEYVDDAHGLQAMVDAGSRWVTINFYWAAVEPAQDVFDWSSFDDKVQSAQAAGMDVFVMFTSNPGWAAELAGGPVHDIQDLIDVSRRMAERYDGDGVDDAPGSPCIHYWSFYAEPDNVSPSRAQRGWGYWGDNGAGFADMLYHVSPAIHAANPRAQVLIGGLAYDGFVEPPDTDGFRQTFLADTLRALDTYPGGASKYIDAVAFHYYPISEYRWPSIREKALEIRGIMAQYGVESLPLICPEAAYWSSTKFGSSEVRQAQRLVQMHVRGLSVGVRPLTWYIIYDRPVPDDPEQEYPDQSCGLLRVDGQPKLAYFSYVVLARELEHGYYKSALTGPDVEGYVFQVGAGREMTVLWAKGAPKDVSFPLTCLRRVDVLDAQQSITDGGVGDRDGAFNGRVSVRVDQDNPIYVEPCH